MADSIKSPTAILIVLILVSLSLCGGVFYLLQKERARSLALEDQVKELDNKQKITEAKLVDAKKNITTLEAKVQETQTKIDALTSQVDQEKGAKEDALAQLAQLKSDLDQQKAMKSDLERKLNQNQDDLNKIQVQLKELDNQKSQLETKIQDLEGKNQELEAKARGVELGKIVVGGTETQSAGSDESSTPASAAPSRQEVQQQQAAPAAAGSSKSEGKVLVINKEYNFVVLNVGSKDGVAVGKVFSILHNGKNIGEVKVDKVHDSMSAAGFLSSDLKDKISEGDKAVLKAK